MRCWLESWSPEFGAVYFLHNLMHPRGEPWKEEGEGRVRATRRRNGSIFGRKITQETRNFVSSCALAKNDGGGAEDGELCLVGNYEKATTRREFVRDLPSPSFPRHRVFMRASPSSL